MNDFPEDVMDQARAIVHLCYAVDAKNITDVIAGLIRSDATKAAQVTLALALMADPMKYLKEAHAAFNRGERTPRIEELEREYQRTFKRDRRRSA